MKKFAELLRSLADRIDPQPHVQTITFAPSDEWLPGLGDTTTIVITPGSGNSGNALNPRWTNS